MTTEQDTPAVDIQAAAQALAQALAPLLQRSMRVAAIDPAALDTEQAAVYIGVAPQTLRNWQSEGDPRAPRSVSYGRSLRRYLVADLDAWLAEQTP